MRRLCLLAVLAAGVTRPVTAQTRDWRPSDRTVIGDFTRITAVAASSDKVYVTSPTALIIWRPQFRQWEGPFNPPDPGMLDRVFAALVDPLDNSLWLARTDGWVHHDPNIQLWDRGNYPGLQEIAFDLDAPGSGLFIRTPSGWMIVPRGSPVALPGKAPTRPLRPASVEDAVRTNPALQANSAAILLTSRLRSARFTAAAQGFAGRGWYLGTWGLGLLYLPDGGVIPERLAFGIPGERVSALFDAPGGVWVATERTATDDPGISFVSADLTDFRWLQGNRISGFPFSQARRLMGLGSSLWAATDQGVARINPEDGRVDLIDQQRGLPDSRVLALASRRGRIAVGTLHGVATMNDSLQVQRVAPGFSDAATAVALSGDTVWVGTSLGLFAATPGETDLIQPEGMRGSVAFRAPVVNLVWLADTLIALTEDRTIWRNPRTGTWNLGPVFAGVLGRLRDLVPYRDGFYLAGERGFAYARLNAPPLRPILFPLDLPGEVSDIALDDQYLWVGTARGLVRWRLDAIGP